MRWRGLLVTLWLFACAGSHSRPNQSMQPQSDAGAGNAAANTAAAGGSSSPSGVQTGNSPSGQAGNSLGADAGLATDSAQSKPSAGEDAGPLACADRALICAAGSSYTDMPVLAEFGHARQICTQKLGTYFSCGVVPVHVDAEGCVESADCSQISLSSIMVQQGENPVAVQAGANADYCACLTTALENTRFACAVDGVVRNFGAPCTG